MKIFRCQSLTSSVGKVKDFSGLLFQASFFHDLIFRVWDITNKHSLTLSECSKLIIRITRPYVKKQRLFMIWEGTKWPWSSFTGRANSNQRAHDIPTESPNRKMQLTVSKKIEKVDHKWPLLHLVLTLNLVALQTNSLEPKRAISKALKCPYFKGDKLLLDRITRTEVKSAVASQKAAYAVQRLAERGLKYIKRREINL